MIRALEYKDQREFRQARVPGSVYFGREVDGTTPFWFCCPCGCNDFSRIPIGQNVKPDISPSWRWNGSFTEPTLTPSVRQLNCGWHGWLAGGYWESV